MNVAPMRGGTAVQDHVALAEIELCGELIIAASAAAERLSVDRIDEVLRVWDPQDNASPSAGGRG
ncbi:hypothetical protein [Streptomyces alboniger]|uniref:Uncharacterized protein n=1 Tax=Streptomyces alboniger TaxID=132473 RepID=A0A5J6HK77_STRAD|nr:hypothetical protein [Streptomyces alboniger]QEV18884.1 hypothetical protein CP975_16530 [Streptomyces alboniger]